MASERPTEYSHRQPKRSLSQMEHDGPSSPSWPNFNRLSASREPSNPPSSSRLSLPRMRTMPRRYPGDGLDFRRPVAASAARNEHVIDLTEDDNGAPHAAGHQSHQRQPRAPRFGRDIIDLDDDQPNVQNGAHSPEIEILSHRRISPPPGNRENDVEFVRSNALPETEAQRRRQTQRDNERHMIGNIAERLLQINQTRARLHEEMHRHRHRPTPPRREPVAPPRANRAHIQLGFRAPSMLDFEMVGFDLGLGGERERSPAAPPSYDAPSKAPEGFTRSPGEVDPLVCPNCGEELCVGTEAIKRQVWIVKTCGHVYCGDCTAHRAQRKSAKGKEKQAPPRTKPFQECAVEGCTAKTRHHKSMIQVFL